MSLRITDQCISCDVCEPACPNEAIYESRMQYSIDSGRCTECVGHFDSPQCVSVCPVECIEIDLDLKESRDDLNNKYERLVADNLTERPLAEK
ncbi:YfhL family 4Fe-4S dicluster ferredoxin [Burkholderia cepacia]|uniref:YfhL family 4Fe-4S dicluster ferredoxin n=1 Tax=Burkholderia cepacia TaxID=292 RepID=UPI001CF19A80|nr:YfhL family 4Fe-4S dicluster ferredoxin [Burkholderia cepacia]MCA8350726.1 YfhL family 4Fe-4S dicluster ferredoxin [Burkholderia cepacia]